MNPARRNELLEDALLRPPTKVGRYELRPLTAASFVILKRMKNPLVVAGETPVDSESPEGMLAALAFVYVHGAPLPEVLRNSRDPEAFEDAVLTFAHEFPIEALGEALQAITGEVETAAAGASEAESDEDEEGSEDPNGLRRPGSRAASSQSRRKPAGRRNL